MEVFIIAAISTDGFIAQDPTIPSTQWTSPEDTKWFHQKTTEAGVIVMGKKTYLTIPEKHRPLKERKNIIYTTHPEKFDPIDTCQATNESPKTLIDRLSKNYDQVAICGGASIYTLFMNAGVVSKLYLTIEPILFGSGTKLFDKPLNQKLQLLSINDLATNSKVLEYEVSS